MMNNSITLRQLVRTAWPVLLLIGVHEGPVSLCAAEPIRFNRDILPVLADHCLACHGPDAQRREAGLRLDVREQATLPAESGEVAIVPGSTARSHLLARIFSTDAESMMPPPGFLKPLTIQQKELLREWIAQGATYEQHWSYVPLATVPVPAVREKHWPRHPLDRFVLARLESEGLSPSPEADREMLMRRVSLDLIGLPPAPEEVDAFVSDRHADAYERLVDRLLQSPHFGERMAIDWLDAARYADSNGYQVDRDRELWPWRDWVIRAFNANLPFDQFTIEQLAGDLLPEATLEQRIATGFHRNHMLNEEGGIIDEEFLAEYTADRVETTAAVWLGQTFNCCRCHDHKFDPFTQRDFYGLKAFFHNVPERGVGLYSKPIRQNSPPFVKLRAPDVEAKIRDLQQQLTAARAELAALPPESPAAAADPNLPHVPASAPTAAPGGGPAAADPGQPAAPDKARQKWKDRIQSLEKKLAAAELEIPTTLVMEEMATPRPTFILIRGAYDKPGQRVTADTPSVLLPLAADQPRNRLGLARWLVDARNPLPARVTVNRLWQHVFGTGLVVTSEDFGSQGARPSHPELLDWLAGEFVRSGWDVKQLLKAMVTSATYRQQSRVPESLRERDPENRLLARSPRFRLQAELVRDQALAASGLLNLRLGGPSVKPYHPPGLYEQVTAGSGNNVYVPDRGDGLRRRSLYTYWKRSVPHPAMLVFDVPFRETCTLRRARTNTPLQALNLMNDPTYVEAARFLAQRMCQEGGDRAASRLEHGVRLLLARRPDADELSVLRQGLERARRDFRQDPDAARELLAVGAAGYDTRLDAAELAAYTSVACTLLNLDEAMNRP